MTVSERGARILFLSVVSSLPIPPDTRRDIQWKAEPWRENPSQRSGQRNVRSYGKGYAFHLSRPDWEPSKNRASSLRLFGCRPITEDLFLAFAAPTRHLAREFRDPKKPAKRAFEHP